MSSRRRRRNQSDWIAALQRSKRIRKLRSQAQPTSLRLDRSAADPLASLSTSGGDNYESAPLHPVASTERGNAVKGGDCESVDSSAQRVYQYERNQTSCENQIPELDEDIDEDQQDILDDTEVELSFQPFHDDDCYTAAAHINSDHEVGQQEHCFVHPYTEEEALNESALIERSPVETSPERTIQGEQMQAAQANIDFLRKMRKKWENHLALSGVIAVVGSVRYTVDQYEFTRDVLAGDPSDPNLTWPPYSRAHDHFQDILKFCMPHNELVELPRKCSENTTEGGSSCGRGHETEKVRIFFPSSWAKLDISSPSIFPSIQKEARRQQSECASLERSRIVTDRMSVLGASQHLFVQRGCESFACGPGSVLKVTVSPHPRNFNFPNSYDLSSHSENIVFNAMIVATWCVGAAGKPNMSSTRAVERRNLSTKQVAIIKALSTGFTRPSEPVHFQDGVLPGDVCTLLSSEQHSESQHFEAVLLHRFWRYADGIPSKFILWVRVSKEPHSATPNRSSHSVENARETRPVQVLEKAEHHLVSNIDLRRLIPPAINSIPKGSHACNTLADGTPFIVYRILLYCDDFQQSTSHYTGGSAGGCYFLPLSIPPEERRSTSAVRVISLTPPGVSTNEVLHYIADDLVEATTKGVHGTTPDGNYIRIFIDVVGFVGDYPASAGVVDLFGHVGRAPCTLCTFRRLQDSEAKGSKYGYTTSVNAGNSTFLRHAERYHALRESEMSDGDANLLGMVPAQRNGPRDCPLFHLSRKLQSRISLIPFDVDGFQVVPGLFDPYRSNVVAPDHLLTGLAKDVLNTAFQCLPTDTMRIEADIYICAALRENGLLQQNELFNVSKKKLHSMTLSHVYCVLLVAHPCMDLITSTCPPDHAIRHAVPLVYRLSRLVALTYWWPTRLLDGSKAVEFVRHTRDKYFSKLKQMSKEYVHQVDQFCTDFNDLKSPLDKPNLHRLIELYEHTIPAFGHAREFMELVFETAHQPLKRCISRSNNHNAHIFAVENCIGNDWQGRIAFLSREVLKEDSFQTPQARRGLRRLLLGEEAEKLNETTEQEFIVETDEILRKLFTNAVQRRFGKDNMVSNFVRKTKSAWKARGSIQIKKLSSLLGMSRLTVEEIVYTAIEWLDAFYPPIEDDNDLAAKSIRLYASAKLVKETDDGQRIGKSYGFDVITHDCIVHAILREESMYDKLIQTTEDTNGIPVFLAIIAILHRKGDIVWAICSRCSRDGDTVTVAKRLCKNSVQLLRMTPGVRRIAAYHVCRRGNEGNSCTTLFNRRSVIHNLTPLQGAKLRIQGRREGYPPRQA